MDFKAVAVNLLEKVSVDIDRIIGGGIFIFLRHRGHERFTRTLGSNTLVGF